MTKTFHRGTKVSHREQKETKAQPKYLTLSSEELQRIKDDCFAEGRKAGFGEGIQYIVTTVENIICKQLGFNNSEELRRSGKMPAVWIAALVTSFGKDYEERQKKKAGAASGEVRRHGNRA